MPIYEYRCRKCESVVERIQGVGEKPLSKCPSCGGKLERLMSPGAFVLKGSGSETRVDVLTKEGAPESSKTSERILTLLHHQLK